MPATRLAWSSQASSVVRSIIPAKAIASQSRFSVIPDPDPGAGIQESKHWQRSQSLLISQRQREDKASLKSV